MPSAYGSLFPDMDEEWPEEKQPWVVWADPDKARRVLAEAGHEDVAVYRSVHTNVFSDVDELLDLIWNTCAFIDLSSLGDEKKKELREFLKNKFEAREGDALFVLFCANLIVGKRKAK